MVFSGWLGFEEVKPSPNCLNRGKAFLGSGVEDCFTRTAGKGPAPSPSLKETERLPAGKGKHLVKFNGLGVVPFAPGDIIPRKGLDMKVLLLKDVYKLGRAGDVKKVADGYGRNFLLPQGLAVLASSGALKQVEQIRKQAAILRAELNKEMGGVAEQINGMVLNFTSKAGETGKLYGSITTQMIAEGINDKLGTKVDRHQIEFDPIRTLGEHKGRVRLTVDLVPTVTVFVYREGEAPVVKEEKAAPVEETPVVEETTAAPETEEPAA